MTLRQRAVRGAAWVTVTQVVIQVVSFVVTIALARLLTPDDFGLVALATVFTGLIGLFESFGIDAGVVRDQKATRKQISSLFWLSMTISVLLAVITATAAPLVGYAFDDPRVVSLVRVLSINFVIHGLARVPMALMAKEMRFGQTGSIQTVGMIVGGVGGITMAALGFGAWAIVAKNLLRNSAIALLVHIVSAWRPTLEFSLAAIREHASFGLQLQANTLLNWGVRHADDVIIGRVLGSIQLGFYQMAYGLLVWPIHSISNVVGRVAFPTLSAIQENKQAVKKAYLEATRLVALVSFPVSLGMVAVIPDIVYGVLGAKWAPIIPVFRIIGALAVIQTVTTTIGWIFMSQGRMDLPLKLRMVLTPFLIIGFLIGVQWGLQGVAFAVVAGTLVGLPWMYHMAGGLIEMRGVEVIRNVAPVGLVSLAMMGIVLAMAATLPENMSALARLGVQVAAGASSFAILAITFRLQALEDARSLLKTFLERGSAP